MIGSVKPKAQNKQERGVQDEDYNGRKMELVVREIQLQRQMWAELIDNQQCQHQNTEQTLKG